MRIIFNMDKKVKERENGGVIVKEKPPETKQPRLYKVIMVNDDYTPMEFVVHVLEYFFKMNRTQATQVMLEVHTSGKGTCGIFTYELAETKSSQVVDYARENGHPLICNVEPD